MHNIRICFLNTDFESDVYELIRAFYPESAFTVIYQEEDAENQISPDLDFCFRKADTSYRIEQRAGTIRTEEVPAAEGLLKTSREALLSCSTEEQIRLHKLRKEQKDRIKTALYDMLCQLSGRTLPWGCLTGIRPVKLVTDMLEQGMSNAEAAVEMRSRYMVSREKTALAVAIANREKDILKGMDLQNGYSLYAGIPFCPSICMYCSFSSFPLKVWASRTDEYLDALIHEAQETASMMKETGRKLHTIYIGGGTPTTLSPEQLKRLLHVLTELFYEEGVREFTVEAGRPDSITKNKLLAIRDFPVSRISVNPQTMNQKTLDLIGRQHTVDQVEKAFYQARQAGFDNINMDLIVGLPGEDKEMVRNTLERINVLHPDSLTVHSLAVKRAARLNIFRDEYAEMTYENSQEILDMTTQAARQIGMFPYYLYRQKNMKGNFENVGYASDGKAGIYNILIMEEKEPIIALGAGGASKFVLRKGNRIERAENVKDVKSYIERIDEMIERKRTGIRTWIS